MAGRNTIKNNFQTGDKPTQSQYAQLIDSAAHTTEDFDKMGGGLKPHSAVRPYKTGEAILVDGVIRLSRIDQTGAYNEALWVDQNQNVSGLGIPAYDPETNYTTGDQVTNRNAIYEATDDVIGVEPGVDPDWATYWEVILYTEGGLIPIYQGGFVKNGTVYSYRGNDVTKGFYRANYVDPEFDGGFKSTDFATELAATKWVLEAVATSGSVTVDANPTDGSSNPVSSNGVFDALALKENVSNKATSFTTVNDTLYPTVQAVKNYADALVVGLWDDRGSFDASGGAYPSTGGSGTAGAVKKGDIWTVSVAGTLPTSQVVEVGDTVRALQDAPGNTQGNWAIQQNNIGYVAENSANKSTSVETDKASNTKYSSAKSVYDWVRDMVAITDVTEAGLNTLVTGSELVPGKRYRLTDTTPAGIIVTAATANTLEPIGEHPNGNRGIFDLGAGSFTSLIGEVISMENVASGLNDDGVDNNAVPIEFITDAPNQLLELPLGKWLVTAEAFLQGSSISFINPNTVELHIVKYDASPDLLGPVATCTSSIYDVTGTGSAVYGANFAMTVELEITEVNYIQLAIRPTVDDALTDLGKIWYKITCVRTGL